MVRRYMAAMIIHLAGTVMNALVDGSSKKKAGGPGSMPKLLHYSCRRRPSIILAESWEAKWQNDVYELKLERDRKFRADLRRLEFTR